MVDKFYEGLNKGVYIEIMRQDIWPESLDQWQEAAQRTVQHSTIRHERTRGQGNWGLSTHAARWKKALEGKGKGQNTQRSQRGGQNDSIKDKD